MFFKRNVALACLLELYHKKERERKAYFIFINEKICGFQIPVHNSSPVHSKQNDMLHVGPDQEVTSIPLGDLFQESVQ